MAIFKLNTSYRECLQCGHRSEMKTWFDHLGPLLLALILLCFYIIPGLILIAWGWGKYKCSNCGALGKNKPVSASVSSKQRSCPFCAEDIRFEAIVCKHCGRDLPQPGCSSA